MSGTPPRAAAARLRRLVKVALRRVLRGAVASSPGLRLVNRIHAALPLGGQVELYRVFAKDAELLDWRALPDTDWLARVGARSVRLPMGSFGHLGWEAALAFRGHEPEVHLFYEELLATRPPRLVLDVGANYGLHTLKFLAHGVRVIAFEPNPACHPYLREACRRNGWTAEIEELAVGDGPGVATLWAPVAASWLGTTRPAVRASWSWAADAAVSTLRVPATTLDSYTTDRNLHPDLVKLDIEGAEVEALRGARGLLDKSRPLVVFESWADPVARRDAFTLLRDAGYTIRRLTGPDRRSLDLPAFLASSDSNHLAAPEAWPAQP